MNEKPYLSDSKNCRTCIGQVVYLNATNAFSVVSFHSDYTLLVKITTEIKVTISPSFQNCFSMFCAAFDFYSHTEKD